MEEKWLGNRTEYPFEGYNFKGFRDYDEYLSSLYGDYMTLPPENERETHTNAKVDLSYQNPKATPKWFETAKKNHGKAWVTHVKKQAGGS